MRKSLAPNLIVPTDDDHCGNQLTGELAPDVAQEELFKEKQMGRSVNCSDSELSTYLQALAEGYLPTFYSDTSQSVQSKSMSIASKSFRRGKKTVVFHGFPYLKMSRNLTENHGAELLTSWLAAFRVKTSALPETAQDLTENAAECGTTWPASLAKFDPDTSSWKTAQLSLLGGLEEFSETWPRWGLMRAGECWERQTLVPLTSVSASGSWQSTWPTPTVCGNYNRKGASATSGDGLATAVTQRTYPTATATAYKGWSPNHNRASTDDRLDYTVEREAFNPGQQTPPMRLNPAWVEWLMGWPIGHTELKPLAMDKYHEWLRQHGGF